MKQAKLTRAKPGDIAIYLFFILLAFITIYPFYYVVIMSLANAVATSTHVPYILPYVFDFTGYITVFQDAAFFQALGVSLFVTIVGVTINMMLSIMGAYALSKKTLIGRKVFLYLILFTMLFSGGLVPSYLNIKNLGMVNSIWSMIIPTALSTYYMIIMKNYFLSLPESLEEAARIDGANSFIILVRIIIPISMPFVATFALFYISSHVDDAKLARILSLYDYLCSEEGTILSYAGIEGDTYEKDADGKITYLTEGSPFDKYKSMSTFAYLVAWNPPLMDANTFPQSIPQEYFDINDSLVEITSKLEIPEYNYDCTTAFVSLGSDFSLHVEEDMLNIMTGTEPVETMWQNIINTYKNEGLEDVIQKVNDAV